MQYGPAQVGAQHVDPASTTTSGIQQPREGQVRTTTDATTTSPTPQQWLSGVDNVGQNDPLTLLVGGMNQLQAALMKQMDGDQSPEAVKPGTTTLPALKAINPRTSPIDVQDWLELVAAPMSDLSNTSATWWAKVRELASMTYKRWTQASPIERLNIQPPFSKELEEGRYARVNARAASMIMLALDSTVSGEIVARRLTQSTPALLFRILTLYQPGGEYEKGWVLKQLQSPEPASDAVKALETLRSWSRWSRRSEDLGLTRPDPTILARGLTSIVQPVLERDYEANFRTSLIRNSLKIDTAPTNESVADYLHHLLAEMEGLSTGSGGAASSSLTSTPTPAMPKMKELRMPPKPSSPAFPATSGTNVLANQQDGIDKAQKRAGIQCRYFGKSAKGCTRGKQCPYQHSWDGLERAERCLVCGGKGHLAKECPTKKTVKPKPGSHPSPASTASPSPTAASSRAVRVDESKNEVHESTQEPPTSSSTTTTSELKEMLAEAGKVLKALSTAHVKSLQTAVNQKDGAKCKVLPNDGDDCHGVPGGLLDSGASNPLRQAAEGEIESATKVRVTLAGEDTRVLNQNPLGTIIVPKEKDESVQPIVPLGALVTELGCVLHWTKTSLKLVHPRHGHLRVQLRNNCPEIAVTDALALIKELEEVELKRLNEQISTMSAKLEMIQRQEEADWDDYLREFVRTGQRNHLYKAVLSSPYTKILPPEVQELLIEDFNEQDGMLYLKQLPLTRRERRRLMSSNAWVVHLYSGESSTKDDPMKAVMHGGKVLLEVDVCNSRLWDMHRPQGVYQLLLWAASQGRIDDILGGPPCRTYSALLHRPREGFPEPARSSAFPYGLPSLDARRRTLVDRDTALVAKQLLLWNIAKIARNDRFVGFFMEHPRDPSTYLKGNLTDGTEPDYPSLWRMGLWTAFKDEFGMAVLTFDQGALGHKAVKPTSAGTNYADLLDLDGLKAAGSRVPATLLPAHELARWAPTLRQRLAQAIVGSFEGSTSTASSGSMCKLSATERELWRRHLEQDHQPYRADCAVCVNAQAVGRPHRRIPRPTAFTMAVDIAGPFKHKGRDMDFQDHRYLLVGAVRFPKALLQVVDTGSYDKELVVKDDEEIHKVQEEPVDACALSPDEVDNGIPEWNELFGDGDLPPLTREDPEFWSEVEDDVVISKGATKDGNPDEERPKPEESRGDGLVEKITELKKPVELTTVYVCRPLRRRTGPAVLTALQELILQMSKVNVPINAIHSDRAREFKTVQMRTWLADRQISQTRTSGSEAAGNSTAELGVKWFKARTRSLLRTASASPEEWPLAAAHAANGLWRMAFPGAEASKGTRLAFGQTVWFKAKGYRGVKEREMDAGRNKDLPPRWKRGSYRGVAQDVSNGHIILREDGGLSIAKGIKGQVVEPHMEEPPLLPAHEVELVEDPDPATPSRRVRTKSAIRMIKVEDEDDGEEWFEELASDEVEELRMVASRDDMLDMEPEPTRPSNSLIRKAEVQYTKDVEAVLDELVQGGDRLQVVHNVSLEDVKKNIDKWKASAQKEYGNLKDAKDAFTVTKRRNLPEGCRVVPGKGVFTVKPDGQSFRRKTRFVACGNFVPADESLPDLFATGLDASSLRTMLAFTSTKVKDGAWQAALTDIRQAFVLAPWIGGPVAIQPPSIAVSLGLCEPDDLWLVKKSLYGLREAPAVWAKFRDSVLRGVTWTTTRDNQEYKCALKQLAADEQIWRMVDVETNETLGYALVYVDDVLMIGCPEAVNSFYQWLAEKWECDDLTVLTTSNPLRFLGMELHLTHEGYEVGQKGFVEELLRSHGHSGKLSASQGSRDAWLLTLEEEEALADSTNWPQVGESPQLREAQRRVGELLWLTSRTRPDLQYATAILASRVSKAPELVNELGNRLLDYLAYTKDYRLTYKGEGDPNVLQIFTDSSFSPSSSRSHGAVAIFYKGGPIMWRSARQALVTLSTAESELVEGIEGTLMGLSVRDLVKELNSQVPLLQLHVDNQAAIALLQGSSGSWRTRHLRLRSSWFRERATAGEVVIVHEPGDSQRADLGTKPLPGDRLQHLVSLWGVKNAGDGSPRVSRFSSSPLTTSTSATTSMLPASASARPTTTSSTTSRSTPAMTPLTGTGTWLRSLAMLCTWCTSRADALEQAMVAFGRPQQGNVTVQIPWEFYIMVIVVIVGVIGLWEVVRSTWTSRVTHLATLRAQARMVMEAEPLSRGELTRFQELLSQDPGTLTIAQAEQLLDYRTRFSAGQSSRTTRPASVRRAAALRESVPVPSVRTARTDPALSSSMPCGPEPSVPPTSTMRPGVSSHQPNQGSFPLMVDVGTDVQASATKTADATTQTAPSTFEYLPPTPTPTIRVQLHDGPFFHVPGREVVHAYRNCWGLRNAGTVHRTQMCRCCAENEGRRMY